MTALNTVKIEPSETQKVLASMLCENTGSHMLDSGGAYGRNWERNQGTNVEDWINSPAVKVDKYCGPIVNVFHYLDAHLEYDEELDNEFQEWINQPERENESYFSCVYEWCAKENSNEYIPGGLTYNYDNNLSQDFQADTFIRDGEDYVCLSIHGGCDIRGGYTRPRIFRAYEYFMMDIDAWTLYANENTGRKGKSVTIDYRGGELYYVEEDRPLSIRNYYYITDEGEDEPMTKWVNLSELEWDDNAEKFKCPDLDGYIDFDAMLDW